jgi:hypothetical protein
MPGGYADRMLRIWESCAEGFAFGGDCLSGLRQMYLVRGSMIATRSKAMASAGKISGSSWRILRVVG